MQWKAEYAWLCPQEASGTRARPLTSWTYSFASPSIRPAPTHMPAQPAVTHMLAASKARLTSVGRAHLLAVQRGAVENMPASSPTDLRGTRRRAGRVDVCAHRQGGGARGTGGAEGCTPSTSSQPARYKGPIRLNEEQQARGTGR